MMPISDEELVIDYPVHSVGPSSSRQAAIYHVSHYPQSENKSRKSRYIRLRTAPSPHQTVVHQERKSSRNWKADSHVEMDRDMGGSVHVFSRSHNPSGSSGYVNTMRQRQMTTGSSIVSLPQVNITPPTPTLCSCNEPTPLDFSLLVSPPLCHKRKDRKEQNRRNAEKALMLRIRRASSLIDAKSPVFEEPKVSRKDYAEAQIKATSTSTPEIKPRVPPKPRSRPKSEAVARTKVVHASALKYEKDVLASLKSLGF